MTWWLRFGVWALACWPWLGCSVTQTMVAPGDEYMAYRRVRVSQDLADRLKASSDYLKQYPKGRWREEVRPWFERAEARYYEYRRENTAGVATYLEVLPDGPHAAEARERLRIFRAMTQKARGEQLGLEAQQTEQRLARLSMERERARDSFSEWLGRLLAVQTWGERTSALDSDFLFEWRLSEPRARCVDDRCSKLVRIPYAVAGGGGDARREMIFEVVLLLDQGMLRQARLEGPQLFSRLYEVSTARTVAHNDGSGRVSAIAFTVDVIGGAAEARFPRSRCGAEAVAPVVLARSCDGLWLRAAAAEKLGEDDRVLIGSGEPPELAPTPTTPP